MTLFVEVEVESERAELIDAASGFAAVPEVQQCYYVTGEADFILVVTVSILQPNRIIWRPHKCGKTNS